MTTDPIDESELSTAALLDRARIRIAELERLTRERTRGGWYVARAAAGECLECNGAVVRGQAYEVVPDAGDRQVLRHVHCPDPPG